MFAWLLACSAAGPTSPEAAVLRFAETRAPADGAAARALTAEALAAEPAHTWLHYLHAYAARLGGDPNAEQAALSAAGPDADGWYRWFFAQDDERARAYLACHQVHLCLQEKGEPLPGFLLRDDLPRPAAPLSCGGRTVQPSTCPADYSLFEQQSLRSRGTDRLAKWRADGAPVDATAFAASVGITPGKRVADIGSGTGWFALPFARAVGPEGRVYAVEIDPGAIPLTRFLAEHHGLPQLVSVLSRPDDVTLQPASIDVAWLSDTLKVFYREDRRAGGRAIGSFLDGIARALVDGGALVVAEKPDDPGKPDAVRMEELQALVAAHGFTYVDTVPDYLPGRHVMRFRK